MGKEIKLNKMLLYGSILPILTMILAFLGIAIIRGVLTIPRLLNIAIFISFATVPILTVFRLFENKINAFYAILKLLVILFVLVIHNNIAMEYIISIFMIGSVWVSELNYFIAGYQIFLVLLTVIVFRYDLKYVKEIKNY